MTHMEHTHTRFKLDSPSVRLCTAEPIIASKSPRMSINPLEMESNLKQTSSEIPISALCPQLDCLGRLDCSIVFLSHRCGLLPLRVCLSDCVRAVCESSLRFEWILSSFTIHTHELDTSEWYSLPISACSATFRARLTCRHRFIWFDSISIHKLQSTELQTCAASFRIWVHLD